MNLHEQTDRRIILDMAGHAAAILLVQGDEEILDGEARQGLERLVHEGIKALTDPDWVAPWNKGEDR